MRVRYHQHICLLTICLLISNISFSQITLPKLVSEGMILQRGESVKIWGWAAPNQTVNINFIGKTYKTRANSNGDWSVKLAAQKAGGPHQMVLTASNKIVLNDILYGDVWLCSGQSNMELEMKRLIDKYPDIIANAENKNIRHFLVPDEYDFQKERKDFSSGRWESANPKSVLGFSAVGYFFANELYRKYQVPIGIINAALGGSPAEAWMSEKAIQNFPAHEKELKLFKNQQLIDSIQHVENINSNKWYLNLNQNDLGLKSAWAKNDEISNDWPSINMPNDLNTTEFGSGSGVVWLKKEINLPAKWEGKSAKLLLGTLRDADSTFINGKFVGNTTYMYPPRRYMLPAGVLKAGKNTITVRLVVNGGNGGFIKDKPYQLILGADTLSLEGAWKYSIGAKMVAAPSTTFIRWKPVGLYNAMIAPLKNVSIKGITWYQGESNTGRPYEYGALMRTLISDWRATFGKDNLPFIYVQLANYMEAKPQPTESGWAVLREQQRKLTGVISNTAMAVILDLGEWNDIHPLNKMDVGKRLALQAQKIAYRESIISSGPVFKDVARDGNKLIISFSEVGKGLVAKNGGLKYFAVAGRDNKFVWAEAKIMGVDKIVLSNSGVASPIKVRYAWADNPESANLYNSEGLPASSFEVEIKK